MASPSKMGKSDFGRVEKVEEASGKKMVSEVSETLVVDETKDPIVKVELDPDVVFAFEEGERFYTEFEMARKDMIDTSKRGYKGWKDAYLNANGEEYEYDGSLDTDSAWNCHFWPPSSGDDEDEVSSCPKRDIYFLSLMLLVRIIYAMLWIR